jgi:DNA-binding NarL/FixJ family response regulator
MRFAIIDDHPLVFEALQAIVKTIGEDSSVKGFGTLHAFEEARALGESFDLVLLDLGIPGFTGLQALERIRTQQPDMPVVVLSASDAREVVLQALELGAMGFIPKSARRDVLVRALELVLSGGIYIPPQALHEGGIAARSASSRGVAESRAPGTLGSLTPRQLDVLQLLVQGMPNKVICRELDLSPNTVKSHVSAIFRALDANNRTEAVIAAQRAGLRIDYGRAGSPHGG